MNKSKHYTLTLRLAEQSGNPNRFQGAMKLVMFKAVASYSIFLTSFSVVHFSVKENYIDSMHNLVKTDDKPLNYGTLPPV